MIEFKFNYLPAENHIRDLYRANNWISYLKNMTLTMKGIENSLDLITAYADKQLVGLIRVVGDGFTIIYIQDLLVHPLYQKKGIGRELLAKILAKYAHVRQKVLLTDASDATEYVREFYLKFNFTACNDSKTVAMVRFDESNSGS